MIDPRINVFRHLTAAIAEDMGAVLRASSSSPNIRERLDYSAALFAADGAMMAQAMHIPVHLGAMAASVRAARETCRFDPGDAVLLNDPYAGGSHLPDLTIVSAVHHTRRGQKPTLLGFVANRAHHADIGGMTPGSMPSSSSIFQEGLRVPPVKLVRRGRIDDDLLAIFLANTRNPTERRADLLAQLAANRVGAERLQALHERYGARQMNAATRDLALHAERMMRAALARLPSGVTHATEFMDALDGRGRPVQITAQVTVTRDEVEVDFRGTSPAIAAPLNAALVVTLSAVEYTFLALAGGDLPINEGALAPIRVIVPEGSLLHATYPWPVVAGNTETSQRIVDVLLRALAPARPDLIPAASSGSMSSVALGGIDPRTGREVSYYETVAGGAGASPARDGADAVHTHMTNSRNTPIEALELAYPVRVRRYAIRRGSGGAGRHRGGDGVERSLEALAPLAGSILGDRRRHAPYGLAGGQPGTPGADTILRSDGTLEALPGCTDLTLAPGDILTIATPGGGGHGEA